MNLRKSFLTISFFVFAPVALLVSPFSAHAVTISSTLAVGSQGTQVLSLQDTLVQLGYLQTTPTGYFGSLTRQAVEAFQASEGLDPVGYTGPKTRALLGEIATNGGTGGTSSSQGTGASSAGSSVIGSTSSVSGSNTTSATDIGTPTSLTNTALSIDRTLSEGSEGTDVTELQTVLVHLGLLSAQPTGFFGTLTERAVTQFQSTYGLSPVGYTGPMTRSLLNSFISQSNSSGGSSSESSSSGNTTTSQPTTTITTSSNASSGGGGGGGSSTITTTPDRSTTTTVTSAGGGGGGGGSSAPVSSPTPQLSFTLSQKTIVTGQSTTLNWSSENTSSCVGTNFNANSETTGSVTVSPTASSTTYSISCTGDNGSVTNSTVLTVVPPTAPTLVLSTSASSITSGNSATLSWISTNAQSCTATGFTAGTRLSGSASVSPTVSTTYSMNCTGLGGSISKSVTISVSAASVVIPPTVPSCTLSVNTPSITKGTSATLSWTSTNTTGLSLNQGIGALVPLITGSRSVSPLTTTTYTATATGAGGTATCSATVTVTAPPSAPVVTLTSSATSITSGQSATITWTSTNATSCSTTGFTSTATNGSLSVSPTATKTYSISCTGAGGTGSQSVSITVTQPVTPIVTSSPTTTSSNGPKLMWAPPTLVNPITITLGAGTTETNLVDTQDYIIKLPTSKKIGTTWIDGGHNVIIEGGYVTLPVTSDLSNSANSRGIYIKDSTGTVHVEGVLIDASGGGMSDGIDISAPLATVQIENVLVTGIYGWTDEFHADCIQPFGGVKDLRVDMFTCYTGYQGISIGDDGASIGSAEISRANIVSTGVQTLLPHSSGGYLFWPIGGDTDCSEVYPITVQNLYLQARGGNTFASTMYSPSSSCTPVVSANGQTATYPTLPLSGYITNGAPPGGDYVPLSTVGTNYVSPGYLSSPTIVAPSRATPAVTTSTPPTTKATTPTTTVGLPIAISSMTPTFDDEFNSLSLYNQSTGQGTWFPINPYGGTSAHFYTGEGEYYTYPGDTGTGSSAVGVNPFSLISGGGVQIQAAPTPANVAANIYNQPYTSGELTTYYSFAQQYGYYEMRAKLPAGKGLWPAWWMLAQNRSYPPELDMFEVLGDSPTTLHFTTHYGTSSTKADSLTVPDTTSAYHTYGLLWTPSTVTLYMDGNQIDQQPTPADMNQPMYMLANLAVGGPTSWPGAPSSSTAFPANMDISYIRAYQLPGYPAAIRPTLTLSSANASATNSNAPLVAFTSSATTVSSGASVILTWNSTGGDCTTSWNGLEGPYGSQTLSNITQSTTYTLTCTDQNGGNPNAKSITVTIPTTTSAATTAATTSTPAVVSTSQTTTVTTSAASTATTTTLPTPVVTLTLSPSSITSGQSATLTWTSTEATTCYPNNFNNNTSLVGMLNGSATVSPTTTTSYSIRCFNSSASVTKSTTLTVASALSASALNAIQSFSTWFTQFMQSLHS